MTLPILKPLKELYPYARITFLTSYSAKDIIINNPYIDEILTYNAFWFYPKSFKNAIKEYRGFLNVLRSKSYDLVIEARADIRDVIFLAYRSKGRYRISYKVGGGGYLLTHIVPYKALKHKVEYHLDIVRYLGCKCEEIEWGIYLTKDEELKTDKLLTQTGIPHNRPLFAIHPGARKELKCWFSKGYATLSDALIDKYDASLVIIGSPDEIGLAEKVSKMMKKKAVILAGKITLRETAGILKRCNLFICNDSAPMHIAAAMKTPTVAIFGPSKSNETGPYGNIHRVVEKDFPCRYTCDEDVCLDKINNECMNAITPEDLFNAVKDIMNEIADKGLKLPEKILKG